MVTKKIKHKLENGSEIFVDIGCTAENVDVDADHRFVTDSEKESWNEKLDKESDASFMKETFTEAKTLANIKTGESHASIFGKIAKAISDYITHRSTTATTSVSGHVKLSDAFDSLAGEAADGIAASQKALHDGYTALLEKLGKAKVNYGTCSTAAATAAKTVACDGYELITGAEIVVRFTVTNTAASPTLNVAGTGAKPVYYRGIAIPAAYLAANRTYAFRYNGTQYELVGDIDNNTTYTNASLGQGYGTCDTLANTAAKTATISGYSLTAGGIVAIKFTARVPMNATLNINSKGAKAIFYRGSAVIGNEIKAGDTATLIYDGTRYHVIAIDRDEDTTYGSMGGASENRAGSTGLVPAPAAGDQEKYLRADGTWQDLQGQIDAVNNKMHLITYTSTEQIPGYTDAGDAQLVLSDIFTAMQDNSMLQMPVWKSSLTSFSFPGNATGDYMMLTVHRGTASYGSVQLHDLDNNITYSRSKYGGVWWDWKSNTTDPLVAKYVTGDIDSTITAHAGTAPFVFGHSGSLNSLLGYWVFVITTGYVTTEGDEYYAQIAIGQNGKSATRFFSPSNAWTSWVS